jgi:L-methionine (R)-S-oxide reductase
MSEEIYYNGSLTKEENYLQLLPQIKALISGEKDLTANLANVAAVLKTAFNWWWVGFYLVKNDELVLGPFQGPVACTRIAFGKGVCGQAWKQMNTIVVVDVDSFEGHIACSSASKSEIVVPIIREGKVVAVLDADSEHLGHFDGTDKKHLEQLSFLIASLF